MVLKKTQSGVKFGLYINIHHFIKTKRCLTNLSLRRPVLTCMLIFFVVKEVFSESEVLRTKQNAILQETSGEWWEERFIFSCYVTDALSGFSCGPLSNNTFVFRSIFVQPTATGEGNPVWPLSLSWWKHWHLVTSRRRNVNFSLNLM